MGGLLVIILLLRRRLMVIVSVRSVVMGTVMRTVVIGVVERFALCHIVVDMVVMRAGHGYEGMNKRGRRAGLMSGGNRSTSSADGCGLGLWLRVRKVAECGTTV